VASPSTATSSSPSSQSHDLDEASSARSGDVVMQHLHGQPLVADDDAAAVQSDSRKASSRCCRGCIEPCHAHDAMISYNYVMGMAMSIAGLAARATNWPVHDPSPDMGAGATPPCSLRRASAAPRANHPRVSWPAPLPAPKSPCTTPNPAPPRRRPLTATASSQRPRRCRRGRPQLRCRATARPCLRSPPGAGLRPADSRLMLAAAAPAPA
jgi:hypothetical protein